MIFKEEEIMVPMTLDVFSLADWQRIAEDSFDIGFAIYSNHCPETKPRVTGERIGTGARLVNWVYQTGPRNHSWYCRGLGFGEFAEPPVTTTAPTNQTIEFPTGSLQLNS